MTVSNRCKLTIYLLLIAAHIALVWLLPYFPSQDGPNHLNNLYILKDLLNGGKEWGNYYSANLTLSPNLGFTLIAYPLAQFFPPLITEKIFLTIYIVLMVVSVPTLLRTFDRPVFPLSFLVFPIVFNHSLLMGFYSFAISVPLFILSFTMAWAIRDHTSLFKFICLNLAGLLLFYTHLIPCVFFLISLAAIVYSTSRGLKQIVRNFMGLCIIISPSLSALCVYFGSKPSRGHADGAGIASFQRILNLIGELFSFSTLNLSPLQKVPACLFTALIVIMMYETIKGLLRKKLDNIGLTESERALISLLTVLTAVYLLAPARVGEGSYFNERFPWVILLLLLPLLHVPRTAQLRRAGHLLIVLSVACFFAINSIYLWKENGKVATFVTGLQANIPRGSFVMTFKTALSGRPRVDVLLHASAYYGMFKKCADVGNYEAHFDYFQIRLNNSFPPVPSPGQIELAPETIQWPDFSFIDYLLAWDIDKKEQEKLSLWFHPILRNGEFTMWQRN